MFMIGSAYPHYNNDIGTVSVITIFSVVPILL